MDYFYDGQIRRYVTQFMRVFIGFKYKAGDGEEKHVPVLYGDMTRQVASIIKDREDAIKQREANKQKINELFNQERDKNQEKDGLKARMNAANTAIGAHPSKETGAECRL